MSPSDASPVLSSKRAGRTDHFPFNVISLPFLESNIDNRLCYRVFYSQLIRFQRLCSNRKDFELRTKYLGLILANRGYQINLLEREFCKAISNYTKEFQKWALPLDINIWFKQIFNEQPTNPTTPALTPISFTQPPENSNNHGHAFILMSQP